MLPGLAAKVEGADVDGHSHHGRLSLTVSVLSDRIDNGLRADEIAPGLPSF